MNRLSVWLVPEKNDEKYLSEIMNDLAVKYSAPKFNPHLTLLGDVRIELNKLKSLVNEIFTGIKKFTIKKTGLSQSELFFKTVFIEFELDENLKKLFEDLSSRTDKRSLDTFKPHISLIYKLMPEEEKIKIIKSLDVKNEFVIDRVIVDAPKEGDNDFLDVEGWRMLYKKSLNS